MEGYCLLNGSESIKKIVATDVSTTRKFHFDTRSWKLICHSLPYGKYFILYIILYYIL